MIKETKTTCHWAQLCMAGNLETAMQRIREHTTEHSYCVTVIPTEYIYKYGQESGFLVTFRIHPKYSDSTPTRIESLIRDLAEKLMNRLCQKSCSIMTSTGQTTLLERVEE